jgi:UDP-3-O-[3-hydroxymyristoyl] glucosamine N-acyltransferase
MELQLSELAARLGADLDGDGGVVISGVAGFEDAGAGDLTFVDDPKLFKRLDETSAAAVILPPGHEIDAPALRAEDPRAAFVAALTIFGPDVDRYLPRGIHPDAVIDPSADLAADVAVGAGSVIGAGVTVGAGTRIAARVVVEADVTLGAGCCLYSGSVVRERCFLGDRVILQPGAVIGSDGFGYHPGPAGLVKIPQIGVVVLEDDVEIGANSCVDRATTGETRIGAGSKIDNLCQVGHNVTVGRFCAMSALSGLSGSCTLGDGVTMGGQTGVADHLTLGDGVKVAARSALTRDAEAGATLMGYPAVEFNKAFRLIAHYQRLPELAGRVKELERRLEGLTAPDNDPGEE